MDESSQQIEVPKKEYKKKPSAVKNVSGRRFKVYGVMVAPGAEYTPSEADKSDKRNTKRIDNACKAGQLERV